MNKQILKDLIEKSSLTQREFAKQAGTTEFQISQWLSGFRNIRDTRLQEIAKSSGYIIKINYEILAQ